MKAEGRRKIIKGAVALGLGALVAKILGATYRIPLTNRLGSYGVGLYQMVFPVYTLLLDFSGAAVPSALSKIIASYKREDFELNAYNHLLSSLRLLFFLGTIGTLIMLIFSLPISKLQGNQDAFLGYVFLSPAVLLVAIISCFRGYFQGLMKMSPTAISQVIEQVVKLVFGLLFVRLSLPDVKKAVAGATFAITLSELVAVLYLYATYRKRKNAYMPLLYFDESQFSFRAKTILKTSLPITLIGIMLPLSHVIDSFLIVNLLSTYRADATSLYGVMSGAVSTVIHLPVALCYGVASVAIPAVSSAKTEEQQNKNSVKTILITLIVALPSAVVCYMLAPMVINILFSSLSEYENTVAINLLRLLSPCIVLLSILQTLNAVLIGKGKLYSPLLSLSSGIALKTVLSAMLLKNPNLNIYGSAIATIACYFFVTLVNLILIFGKKVKNASKTTVVKKCIG